jgi:hypothetical protein
MEYRALGAVVCLSAMLGCTAIQLKMRQPGERLVSFPEPVAVEYDCAKRRLPFFKVEETELIPSRLRPGGQLSHRFVYVMCPSRASEVIEGKLHTRIQFKGKTVHSDSVKRELQPGRWVVDSFITLPEKAMPGMYALAARFESPKGHFSFQSDFLVEEGRMLLGLP